MLLTSQHDACRTTSTSCNHTRVHAKFQPPASPHRPPANPLSPPPPTMADPEPASDAPAAPAAPAEEPWTLGRVVQSTRLFLESTSVEDPSSTAAAVSSAAATADGHVASAIHTAYQGLKSLANETPPAIVLGFTCLAVGLPSARCTSPLRAQCVPLHVLSSDAATFSFFRSRRPPPRPQHGPLAPPCRRAYLPRQTGVAGAAV